MSTFADCVALGRRGKVCERLWHWLAQMTLADLPDKIMVIVAVKVADIPSKFA